MARAVAAGPCLWSRGEACRGEADAIILAVVVNLQQECHQRGVPPVQGGAVYQQPGVDAQVELAGEAGKVVRCRTLYPGARQDQSGVRVVLGDELVASVSSGSVGENVTPRLKARAPNDRDRSPPY